ncbi:hypothetical protein BDB00DRAFT_814774 [Zychaea mexicana]|uniref:uncharacterized protein n=1 Tax=Zychaea mexicana TaxID=64656 RepID=UPI0022FE61E1|nr:uncharacterized protein BDB00DRAFT_814774 [Zychaea mexicana]KAI9495136.1 hypothetical protein BDB00DRAFT_814774 [Zychaea mexicana]
MFGVYSIWEVRRSCTSLLSSLDNYTIMVLNDSIIHIVKSFTPMLLLHFCLLLDVISLTYKLRKRTIIIMKPYFSFPLILIYNKVLVIVIDLP